MLNFVRRAYCGPVHPGDLERALGSLGMDGTLFSYEAVLSPHANLVAKVASSDDGRERVEAILGRARLEVREMLDRNRHVVERLRDALLERDELIGDEIIEVILAAVPVRADLDTPAGPDRTAEAVPD